MTPERQKEFTKWLKGLIEALEQILAVAPTGAALRSLMSLKPNEMGNDPEEFINTSYDLLIFAKSSLDKVNDAA